MIVQRSPSLPTQTLQDEAAEAAGSDPADFREASRPHQGGGDSEGDPEEYGEEGKGNGEGGQEGGQGVAEIAQGRCRGRVSCSFGFLQPYR